MGERKERRVGERKERERERKVCKRGNRNKQIYISTPPQSPWFYYPRLCLSPEGEEEEGLPPAGSCFCCC